MNTANKLKPTQYISGGGGGNDEVCPVTFSVTAFFILFCGFDSDLSF